MRSSWLKARTLALVSRLFLGCWRHSTARWDGHHNQQMLVRRCRRTRPQDDAAYPTQGCGPALSDLRQAPAGQPGCHRREQAPWSGTGLHRREAEGAGHVAVGEGTAAAWPAQSHVQGRIGRSKAGLGRRLRYLGLRAPPEPAPHFNPATRKGGYRSPQNSDICNWRKK